MGKRGFMTLITNQEERVEEQEEEQSFREEAEQDILVTGNVNLGSILDIIQSLVSSVAMLQVQLYREQRTPTRRTR